MAFNIYSIYRKLQPGFRGRRMRLFLETFQPTEETRILDIGGNVYDWEGVVPIQSQITVLNVAATDSSAEIPARFRYAQGDGRRLPFPDQSFDIVYCNSVIEHLGAWEDQEKLAAEARRVGRQVFVQTPNRWFPVEPHFLAFFVHYLPKAWRRRLIPIFSLRGLFRKGDNVEVTQLLEELRLLSHAEMRRLFPDCEIHCERALGLNKSFTAIRAEARA